MLRCPRQITLVLFDSYTLCFSLTWWRLNKNIFNEKFIFLSFFHFWFRTMLKIPQNENKRMLHSTVIVMKELECQLFVIPKLFIRLVEIRVQFNFFSFFPPVVLSPCWAYELPRKRGTCCMVQGHVEDTDESERIFRYQPDRKNRNKTEGNCVRVSADRGRWYWPKFDDTRSRLRWSCSW